MAKRMLHGIFLALLCCSFSLIGCRPSGKPAGRTFCIGANWEIPPAFNGNPWTTGGQTGLVKFWYDSLYFYIPLTGEYVPGLAKSIGFNASDTIVQVELRTELFWEDGNPLSAKDLETTFSQMWVQNLLGNLESLKIVNPTTIEMIFARPLTMYEKIQFLTYPINSPDHVSWTSPASGTVFPFREANARILPLLSKGAKFAKLNGMLSRDELFELRTLENLKKEIREAVYRYRPARPLGNGPFKLKTVTSSQAVLEKNRNYWNRDQVAVDRVNVIRWPSNEVMWGALIAGEIDAAHPATPYDVSRQILKLNPKMKLIPVTDLKEFGFVFNFRRPPTNDPEFRRAIAKILDRDEIRKTTYFYSLTVNGTNPGIIQSQKKRWLKDGGKGESAAISSGVELLEKAGYTRDAEGFFQTPDGKSIDLEILTQSAANEWILGAEIAVGQLRRAGIRAKVVVKEPAIANSLMMSGEFNIAAWITTDMSRFVHPATSYDIIFGKDGFIRQITGMTDPVSFPDGETLHLASLSQILNRNPFSPDAQSIIDRMARVVNDRTPFVSIYEKNLMIFVQDGKRVQGWPAEDDPIWSAATLGIEGLFSELIKSGRLTGVTD